jgi:hypothetical protein
MKIVGRFTSTRGFDGDGKCQKAPMFMTMTEDGGYLTFRFNKQDFCIGDELRIEFEVLGDDDAG